MHSRLIKGFFVVSCLVALGLFFAPAAEGPAKSPLDGIWQWEFTMPDGGKVTPRVKFRTKQGELTGTSRFRAGSETPVRNIVFKGDQLSFDVVREHEDEEVVTHYRGRQSGDTIKGRITSKAAGEEQSYDWVAKRVSPLEGAWTLSVDIGRERPLESKLTLKQQGEKLEGKISAFRRDLDIHKGRFKDGRISFEVERRSRDSDEKSITKYHGKMVGDKMEGQVEMNNFRTGDRETNDWEAVRAD
jgi:hypothetical protein